MILALHAARLSAAEPLPFTQTLAGRGQGETPQEARTAAQEAFAEARIDFRARCRFSGGQESLEEQPAEQGGAGGYTVTQAARCDPLPPPVRTPPYMDLLASKRTTIESARADLAEQQARFANTCINTNHGLTSYGGRSEKVEAGLHVASIRASCLGPEIPIPPAPGRIYLIPRPAGLKVSWDPRPGAQSYRVYWREGAGVSPANGTIVRADAAPITLENLQPGSSYYLVLTSVGSGGESTPSGQVGPGVPRAPSVARVEVPTHVRVYPNPCRADRHGLQGVTFADLPAGATVKLYTLSGRFVKSPSVDGTTARWDLANDAGEGVASGIYLYVIGASGGTTTGRVTVIR